MNKFLQLLWQSAKSSMPHKMTILQVEKRGQIDISFNNSQIDNILAVL